MDEPFGALDPITRFRLQTELRRLHRDVGKTVLFVTHDVDEAIQMGDRIAILREGGVLAQYDTPDEILARPADDFVKKFIGEDRALRRLALRTLADVTLEPGSPSDEGVQVPRETTVRNAVSLMLETNADRLVVVDGDDGARLVRPVERGRAAVRPPAPSSRTSARAARASRATTRSAGTGCAPTGATRCEPALVQHIELTALAVAIGFALAFPLALVAHRYRRFEHPIGVVSALLYTIPSLALFQILVPFTGLTWTTVEIALVAVHARDPVPEHRRRASTARRTRCSRRRAGWGSRGGRS